MSRESSRGPTIGDVAKRKTVSCQTHTRFVRWCGNCVELRRLELRVMALTQELDTERALRYRAEKDRQFLRAQLDAANREAVLANRLLVRQDPVARCTCNQGASGPVGQRGSG
jgi:hypothetical protein